MFSQSALSGARYVKVRYDGLFDGDFSSIIIEIISWPTCFTVFLFPLGITNPLGVNDFHPFLTNRFVSSSQNTSTVPILGCWYQYIYILIYISNNLSHPFSMSNEGLKFAEEVICCYCCSFKQNGLLFCTHPVTLQLSCCNSLCKCIFLTLSCPLLEHTSHHTYIFNMYIMYILFLKIWIIVWYTYIYIYFYLYIHHISGNSIVYIELSISQKF